MEFKNIWGIQTIFYHFAYQVTVFIPEVLMAIASTVRKFE